MEKNQQKNDKIFYRRRMNMKVDHHHHHSFVEIHTDTVKEYIKNVCCRQTVTLCNGLVNRGRKGERKMEDGKIKMDV